MFTIGHLAPPLLAIRRHNMRNKFLLRFIKMIYLHEIAYFLSIIISGVDSITPGPGRRAVVNNTERALEYRDVCEN